MGATEAEWRTLGVSSPLAKGSPGLAGEIYSPPCPPHFWHQAGWVGGLKTSGMLIPVVGGLSLEKGD